MSATQTKPRPGRKRPSSQGPSQQTPDEPPSGHRTRRDGDSELPSLEDSAFDLEAATVLGHIRQVIRASDVFSKKLHRATGLTTAHALTLRAAAELGEVTSRALAAVVAISPATMTTVLDRLERNGYIERYRSTRDRRVVHVRLTESGTRAQAQLPALMDETFMRRFADLPAGRRTEIASALAQVAKLMNADANDAAPADNGSAA